MKGRKPTPTQLKVIAGNPGKRPLNKRDLNPETEIPKAPSHLRGEAKREWVRMSERLAVLNLLTGVDRAALAAYCVAYDTWCEASRHVQKDGAVIRQVVQQKGLTLFGADDQPITQDVHNPWASVMNKQALIMHKFMVEFGMTPSSRTRLSGSGESSGDPDEDFLFGKDSAQHGDSKTIQ